MQLYQVDAFTDRMFQGNPAAVCLLPEDRGEAWMQSLAQEMNLSETAFLRARDDGYGLRWFTPTREVELCGHATLAAAHILWETGHLPRDRAARFHTLSGLLQARWQPEGWIQLDFPLEPPAPAAAPPGLAEALGAGLLYVGRNRMDYLAEVASPEALKAVAPDLEKIKSLDTRGVIVTCAGGVTGFDFLSRFFAPAYGIAEDPVTGSAHCCLGPYWQQKLGKSSLLAHQASARGGTLRVEVRERAFISGQARTVFCAELSDEA